MTFLYSILGYSNKSALLPSKDVFWTHLGLAIKAEKFERLTAADTHQQFGAGFDGRM